VIVVGRRAVGVLAFFSGGSACAWDITCYTGLMVYDMFMDVMPLLWLCVLHIMHPMLGRRVLGQKAHVQSQRLPAAVAAKRDATVILGDAVYPWRWITSLADHDVSTVCPFTSPPEAQR
jgi:hypothetical protein